MFCFPVQVRLSDHNSRGGAEAAQGPLQEWPPVGAVLPGLLGVVGPTGAAVPAVPVSVRRLPHAGGPPPQRTAGRPRRVRLGPHAPQLPRVRLQRSGLLLRLSVVLLLGQGGFLLFPSLLCHSGSFLHLGLCVSVSIATATFPKGAPSKTGRDTETVRVLKLWIALNRVPHVSALLFPLPLPPRLSVGHVAAVHPEKAAVTIGQYLRQLSRQRNFLWFVSMNLIQVKCQKRQSCRCDSFETFHDQLLVLSETGCCVCAPCRCFTAISTTTSSLFSWSISSPTTSRPPRARSYWVNNSK